MTKWATRFWMLVGSAVPAALLAGCTSESTDAPAWYGPRPCTVDTECQYNGGFCNQTTHHCDLDRDASVDTCCVPEASQPDTDAGGDSDAPLVEDSDAPLAEDSDGADSANPVDASDESDGNGSD